MSLGIYRVAGKGRARYDYCVMRGDGSILAIGGTARSSMLAASQACSWLHGAFGKPKVI